MLRERPKIHWHITSIISVKQLVFFSLCLEQCSYVAGFFKACLYFTNGLIIKLLNPFSQNQISWMNCTEIIGSALIASKDQLLRQPRACLWSCFGEKESKKPSLSTCLEKKSSKLKPLLWGSHLAVPFPSCRSTPRLWWPLKGRDKAKGHWQPFHLATQEPLHQWNSLSHHISASILLISLIHQQHFSFLLRTTSSLRNSLSLLPHNPWHFSK